MKVMKKILIGLFIIIVIICVAILFYKSFNKSIEVQEYNLENGYVKVGIPLLAPDFLSNVEVQAPNRREVLGADSYTITIDGVSQTFDLDDNHWWSIISLGVADLNNDGNKEILICRYDNQISPSYRRWSVYQFNKQTKELEYLIDIYDGELVYNSLSCKLMVKYQLHETAYPMYSTVCYDMK